jgi:hypothetical protein
VQTIFPFSRVPVDEPNSGRRVISTAEFARAINSKPQTLRKHYCVCGHFYGVRPIKLPTGRLAWPAEGVESVLAGASRRAEA